MPLLLYKMERDYSNGSSMRALLCVGLLVKSLTNPLFVPIDETRTC